jgi:hypothetical protein
MPYTIVVQELTFDKWTNVINPHPLKNDKDEIDEIRSQALAYAKWAREVDLTVSYRTGLSIYDLAERPFHDWFDDGLSTTDAAVKAMEELGEDAGDMADMMAEIHDYFPESACAPEGMYPDAYDGLYEL